MMKVSGLLAATLLAVAASSGCVSIGQVERLSSAGITYGAAMDELLRATEESGIDADSERLLSQGRKASRTLRENIYDAHAGVTETVTVLERLRRHARLLRDYFLALNALAATDAPARAQTSVQGAAAALSELGGKLRESPLLSREERDSLSQLAGLGVTAFQRHLIVKELRARAALIEQQLRIHEKVTAAV